MKKKFLLTLFFLFFSLSSAFSGIFSDYDFTFYKTISQSLQVFDDSKIGFDYTGFGFLGKRQRSGMFIRIGVQTPFSLPKGKNKTNTDIEIDEETESEQTIKVGDSNTDVEINTHEKNEKKIGLKNYSLTFIMGPATRIITSDRINMYLGIGLRLSHNITTTVDPLINLDTINYKTQLGIDFDVGGRIDLNEKTSFRVGLYATSSIMTFNYLVDRSETKEPIKKPEPYATVFFDILNPSSNNPPISVHAYISMGTHFTSTWKDKYYRYEITSPEIFTGTVIELDGEN